MDTTHGVRLPSSILIEGRKVPTINYYVGPGKASSKPHNAACMTEELAALLPDVKRSPWLPIQVMAGSTR
jgi:hypothetical protein